MKRLQFVLQSFFVVRQIVICKNDSRDCPESYITPLTSIKQIPICLIAKFKSYDIIYNKVSIGEC